MAIRGLFCLSDPALPLNRCGGRGSLGLVHQATNRLKARNQNREKEEKTGETGDAFTDKPDDAGTVNTEAKENVAGGVDDSPQEVEG